MSLTAGTRMGPYEVIAPLGAGGLGEVYRTGNYGHSPNLELWHLN